MTSRFPYPNFMLVLISALLCSCKSEGEVGSSGKLFGVSLGSVISSNLLGKEISRGMDFKRRIEVVSYGLGHVPEPIAFFSSYEAMTTKSGIIFGISAKGKANCRVDKKEYLAMKSALVDKYGSPSKSELESIGVSTIWTLDEVTGSNLTLACWGSSDSSAEMSIYISDWRIANADHAAQVEQGVQPEKAKINMNGLR